MARLVPVAVDLGSLKKEPQRRPGKRRLVCAAIRRTGFDRPSAPRGPTGTPAARRSAGPALPWRAGRPTGIALGPGPTRSEAGENICELMPHLIYDQHGNKLHSLSANRFTRRGNFQSRGQAFGGSASGCIKPLRSSCNFDVSRPSNTSTPCSDEICSAWPHDQTISPAALNSSS